MGLAVWSSDIGAEAGNDYSHIGTIYVDPKGNALVSPPRGTISGSPGGQVKGPDGSSTGVRIDNGHKPAGHPDVRAQQPHAHVPGVTNEDGTPRLPVKK